MPLTLEDSRRWQMFRDASINLFPVVLSPELHTSPAHVYYTPLLRTQGMLGTRLRFDEFRAALKVALAHSDFFENLHLRCISGEHAHIIRYACRRRASVTAVFVSVRRRTVRGNFNYCDGGRCILVTLFCGPLSHHSLQRCENFRAHPPSSMEA